MAQVIYQGFYNDLAAGLVATGVDIRAVLVMSDTTIDVDEDAEVIADFTVLDECDGVGYTQLDIGTVTVAYDASTDRLVIDGVDGAFETAGIAAGSRYVTRILIKRYVDGTDANDVPWSSRDIGPYGLAGGTFDVTWDSTGILYIGSA